MLFYIRAHEIRKIIHRISDCDLWNSSFRMKEERMLSSLIFASRKAEGHYPRDNEDIQEGQPGIP